MLSSEPILTISVASNLLHVHPRTLMLYERSGLIFPFRTGTKRRLYSAKDLDELQFVRFLTQEKRVNLAGVKLFLEAVRIAEKQGVMLKQTLFPDFKPQSLI